MRYTIFSLTLLISGAWSLVCGQAPTHGPRPNILWITCEDMSANLPSYGDQTVATPTIDRLVREGVRYTHMYSTAGVCAPSRSAIISGMYQTSIGTQHMRTNTASLKRRAADPPDIPNYDAVPPPNVKCFTEYLRASGYFCTNNSKTDYQFGNPITAWDENSPKAHWRNRTDKSQPFFSVFNLMVTHESQIWERASKPLRVNPAKVVVPPYYPDTPIIRRDLARYYDNIMVMDSLAGRILGQLETDGLLENTIVVFYSDHGACLPWYKRELCERGTHVPFVVRFPGKRQAGPRQAGGPAFRSRLAGTTDTELHSFVDLAPTMLSLAGVPIPKYMQGQAFLGQQQAKARQAIFGARDRMDEHYDMVRMMRDGRYRYIRNFMPEKPNYQDIAYRKQMPLMQEILRLREAGQLPAVTTRWFQTKPVEELYDLQADPYELTNLAGQPQLGARLRQMRHALADWTTNIGDKGALPERDMVALMYGGSEQPKTAVPIIQPGETITLTCPTPGASIAWQFDGDEHWQLYHQPVRVPVGRTLYAKAIRYGYAESTVVQGPEKLTGKK